MASYRNWSVWQDSGWGPASLTHSHGHRYHRKAPRPRSLRGLRFNKNKTTEELVLCLRELSENSDVIAASVPFRPGKRDFMGVNELQGPCWPFVSCLCFRADVGQRQMAVTSGREPCQVLSSGPVLLSCVRKGARAADRVCYTSVCPRMPRPEHVSVRVHDLHGSAPSLCWLHVHCLSAN